MRTGMARGLARPAPFAAITAAVYALAVLLLPLAAGRSLDLSVFIDAGDAFVSRDGTAADVTVFPDTLGYDGQFFYRLALDPLSSAPSAHGVTLDAPAKRMQRIGYPLLARLASLGRPSLAPAGLLAVNLAGMGVIAACAAWLARRRGLAPWLPLAIVAWPGFLVAATHDTAEIASAALMLTALACHLSGRLWPYCILAAAAALTRETTVPIFAGLLAWELRRAATSPGAARRAGRVAACALAFVPFGAWWLTVSLIWHEAPQSLGASPDLGWPFGGAAAVLLANLRGAPAWGAEPMPNPMTRVFVLWVTCGLIALCATVAARLPRLLRRADLAGLALGWLLVAALMSLLTAGGPLVEPLSCFRAFSECWVVGCLLLAHDPPALLGRASAQKIAVLLAADANIVVWSWTRTLMS